MSNCFKPAYEEAILSVENSTPYRKSFTSPLTTFNYLPITVGNSASPLPVELLDFTAKRINQDVLLNWSTASELNNDRFEIERSINNISFEKIATEKGAGNSTQIINYGLTDIGVGKFIPSGTVVYYRLKQIDFDGKHAYSPINSVLFDENESILLYPNPTKDNLIIRLNAPADQNIEIRIIDIRGAIVKVEKTYAIKGNQEIILNLNDLANGQYKAMFITPEGVSTQKIVISK
ncbi:MAG TPA: T9SS type A sorting domain-containing protein [Bacteroidia bacterium]|nr:T9SS type A sorting domain-containing protein [Bacteroidia bacterium]HRG51837.1 T9SS type A sorting domain-containing protein [Bacteroidia bacterium]